MRCYLLLNITLFGHSVNDRFIPFAFIGNNLLCEQLIKSGFVRKAMAPGYFRDVLMFSDMRNQPFDEIIFAQD